MDIPNRNNWFSGNKFKSIFEDKEKIISDYMKLFFTRTNTMFVYEGLPDTIPKEEYTLIKQRFGSVTLAKANDDKPYALYGGLGGIPNEYYHPTISIVGNPYLDLFNDFKINENCVVIRNDLFYNGLYNINRKYAELLTECDISIRKCLLNIRIGNVIVSNDESTDVSVNKFFEKVIDGDFGFITTKKFMDENLITINDVQGRSNNPLKDLIEMRNYIESCWWMEFGLNANANMKREAINEAEIKSDDKTMIPLIDQMYNCEIEGWEKFNKLFGYNVKVKLSPVWERMKNDVLTDDINNGDGDNNVENE